MSPAQAGTVGDFRVSAGVQHPHEVIGVLDVNENLQCKLLAIPVLSDSEVLGTVHAYTDGFAMLGSSWASKTSGCSMGGRPVPVQ